MTTVRFHPSAETEMIRAAVYYEQQQASLGKRFLASVQDAVNRIVCRPRLYPFADRDVRRCLTKIFPFGVFYRESPEEIVIMAVMHLNRDPEYWKNR